MIDEAVFLFLLRVKAVAFRGFRTRFSKPHFNTISFRCGFLSWIFESVSGRLAGLGVVAGSSWTSADGRSDDSLRRGSCAVWSWWVFTEENIAEKILFKRNCFLCTYDLPPGGARTRDVLRLTPPIVLLLIFRSILSCFFKEWKKWTGAWKYELNI